MAPSHSRPHGRRVPSIIVHGGAGAALENAETYRPGIRAAVAAGWTVLVAGGRALDAVEAAVGRLENDEGFNAGRGSGGLGEGRVGGDWSSDVCSSDLRARTAVACRRSSSTAAPAPRSRTPRRTGRVFVRPSQQAGRSWSRAVVPSTPSKRRCAVSRTTSGSTPAVARSPPRRAPAGRTRRSLKAIALPLAPARP